MSGDRFNWTAEEVTVTPPPPCQACGKPADDPEIPGLCQRCAATIDAVTEELLDREHWGES